MLAKGQLERSMGCICTGPNTEFQSSRDGFSRMFTEKFSTWAPADRRTWHQAYFNCRHDWISLTILSHAPIKNAS